MAKKANKPATPTAPAYDTALLAAIVSATQANSFVYTSVAQHSPLIAAGFVEVNDQMKDANGQLATRATAAGIAAAGKGPGAVVGSAAASSAATKPVASTFTLEAGVAVPTIKRGGFSKGRTAVYPFEQMEVGQSFFVPATPERDDPAMALASTVSSATKRYSVPVTNPDGSAKMIEEMRGQRGPDGKVMKDGQGKMIKVPVQIQEMCEVRKFVIRSVKAENDPSKQNGARIWRVQ